ncbi:MAG TPA: tripartite tricarboxylate transporter substrate-binding protein [Xanthobacteraceae bacterium]
MIMQTKRTIRVALLLALACAPATAQDWPTKTTRIIVPFGPASTPDMVARLVADQLQQMTGEPFIVENKPGAGGNLVTDAVAKAAPNGATVGVSIGGPLAINTLLFSHLPYDPAKDIAAITQLITQPSALVVNAALGANGEGELIALLKRNPGKYNYASIGTGSLSHLAMEAIALQSGTRLVHIPYASSPQAMTAIIRGDAQLGCLPAIAVTPHLASGAVKMLAVSTIQRSPFLPDIPTLKESGINVEADAWQGMIAPGNIPEALLAAIHARVVRVLEETDVREKLATQLMLPVGNSPRQFRQVIDNEITRWAPIIKALDLKIN